MLTAPSTATVPTGDARATARALDWAAVALVAAALVAVAPFLVRHAAWLWVRPHYGAFPLVLLGAGVLAWTRLRTAPPGAPAAPGLAWGGLAGAWALLAGAVVLGSAWLACVATMILIPALAYAIGGRGTCLRALPAWALLWLLVPPPMDLDRLLILQLQALTTGWSSAVLDAFGVFHLVSGNVIEIDGRALLVEQACSGINSLFSLLACTLFLVLLTRRGWTRGMLLLLAAVGWVLAANVARVVLVALLETRWGVSAATGWRHEALGLALFAAAVGLLISTDRLFEFLTRPGEPARDQPTDAPAPTAPEVPAAKRGRLALVAVPAFLLLSGLYWAMQSSEPAVTAAPPAPLATDAELLPPKVGAWDRREFGTETREANSFFGEHSQNWVYARPELAVKASLAYPFPGWHDLTWCYRGTGWEIDGQSVQAPAEAPGGFVEVRMNRPGFRHGFLLFCEFDRSGKPFRARPGGAREPLFRHEATLDRLRDRLAGRPAPAGDPAGAAYQFQVFVEGANALSPEGEEAVRQLFVRLQTHVRNRWAAEAGK